MSPTSIASKNRKPSLTPSLPRIGKGASLQKFESEVLTAMLKGTETEFLAQIEELSVELARSTSTEEKALIRKQIKKFLKV